MVNNAAASISQNDHTAAGVSRLLLLLRCWADASEPSEEANQALAFLDLLLDLITGGGDLGLCGEDGADEGEHGATHGGVEGPAHGAEPGPVGRGVRAAVQLNLV